MALGKNESGQSLGLGKELSLAGKIAGKEVLEDAAVGSIGHDDVMEGYGGDVEEVEERLLSNCDATKTREK